VLLHNRLTITHNTHTPLSSRRGFAFTLIGCIIWDTRSRVKPSEEEERGGDLGISGGGMGHTIYI